MTGSRIALGSFMLESNGHSAPDMLRGFTTSPHGDQAERRSDRLGVMSAMPGGMRPRMALAKLPCTHPVTSRVTARGPYAAEVPVRGC